MDLKRVGFGDVLDNVEEADGRHGTCFTPAVSVGGTNDGLDAALLGVAGAGWARLDEGDLESRLLESHGHEPIPAPHVEDHPWRREGGDDRDDAAVPVLEPERPILHREAVVIALRGIGKSFALAAVPDAIGGECQDWGDPVDECRGRALCFLRLQVLIEQAARDAGIS